MTLTQKDLMLYALGIGFSTGTSYLIADPLKVEDYRYTYEFDENFTCIATFTKLSPLSLPASNNTTQ